MKELIKLKRKEMVDIISGCCDGFLSFNDTNVVKKLSTLILNDLQHVTGINKCVKEIKTILTLTGTCLRRGCEGSQLPMGAEVFVKANKITGKALNHKRMKLVVQSLEEGGYLEYYVGFRNELLNEAITGCFIVKDKLKVLFSQKAVNTFKLKRTSDEVVEIKDENGNIISKLGNFSGITYHRSLMTDYNDCLLNHKITRDGKTYYVQYKQVFSINLDGAGRVYSLGGFQSTEAGLRKNIKIDGEDTVECDITSNHLAIMYTLEGLTLDPSFDCYQVDIQGYSYKDLRLLCKYAIMCMINCKTKVGSYGALHKIVKKAKDKPDNQLSVFNGDIGICRDVIRKLETKHKLLTFFKKDEVLWRKLQRFDSMVCEKVIHHFTKINSPVLCWHDSWRVSYKHKDVLSEVILKSWFNTFGTRDNCFLKIEF